MKIDLYMSVTCVSVVSLCHLAPSLSCYLCEMKRLLQDRVGVPQHKEVQGGGELLELPCSMILSRV
jgi:hypothetical protein